MYELIIIFVHKFFRVLLSFLFWGFCFAITTFWLLVFLSLNFRYKCLYYYFCLIKRLVFCWRSSGKIYMFYFLYLSCFVPNIFFSFSLVDFKQCLLCLSFFNSNIAFGLNLWNEFSLLHFFFFLLVVYQNFIWYTIVASLSFGGW